MHRRIENQPMNFEIGTRAVHVAATVGATSESDRALTYVNIHTNGAVLISARQCE